MADEQSIQRDALERVLARATELQGATGESSEAISESRLLDVAREVGIDAQHLRQALAEERARIAFDAPESGPILNALGDALVDAQRVVPGTAGDVQARLESWVPRMEGMVVRRKIAQRTSWEPRRDPIGNAIRALGTSGRKPELSRVDQVIATVTSIDETRSIVRFDVEMNRLRRSQRLLALLLGVGLNAFVFVGIAVPTLVIASGSENGGALRGALAAVAAVQVAAGYGVWRSVRASYQRTLSRVRLRLEQLLDEVERGDMKAPPSVLGQVASALLSAGTGNR